MRIFQIIHSYKPYIPHFEHKYGISDQHTYNEHLERLVDDRFYALHILEPCLNKYDNDGFYTMWDYPSLQVKWAKEKGWNETDLKKILFAQIEDFKPDVFYSLSPYYFHKLELEKNIDPKIIKIAWFAAPANNGIDFTVYKSRLTNYPVDAFKNIKEAGFRSDLFNPSFDPVMEKYATNSERPIDIFFYGQYLPLHFKTRNNLIEKLIKYKKESNYNVKVSLQYPTQYHSIYPFRYPSRLKSFFSIKIKQLRKFPSSDIVKYSSKPLYGLDLYEELSKSKIVFNSAVDFTGEHKVNMRIFEALGLRCHMLGDKGIYPAYLKNGQDFSVYDDFDSFKRIVNTLLNDNIGRSVIAENGYNKIRKIYSKDNQLSRFKEIISSL